MLAGGHRSPSYGSWSREGLWGMLGRESIERNIREVSQYNQPLLNIHDIMNLNHNMYKSLIFWGDLSCHLWISHFYAVSAIKLYKKSASRNPSRFHIWVSMSNVNYVSSNFQTH